jgi:hypothetical protein
VWSMKHEECPEYKDHSDTRTSEWSRPSEEAVTQFPNLGPFRPSARDFRDAASCFSPFSFPMISRSWTFSFLLSAQHGRP